MCFYGGQSIPGHGGLWAGAELCGSSLRNILHLARDDLGGFGSFVPSRAPVVGFCHLVCWAPVLWWDRGWQSLGTRAPVLGCEVGSIPGRGYVGIPAPREGLFLIKDP